MPRVKKPGAKSVHTEPVVVYRKPARQFYFEPAVDISDLQPDDKLSIRIRVVSKRVNITEQLRPYVRKSLLGEDTALVSSTKKFIANLTNRILRKGKKL